MASKEKIDVEKEMEKYTDEIDALSVELSNKSDLSKEEIKLRFKETLRDIAKPSLDNTHCNFDDELGVGPSDREIEKELKELANFLSTKSGMPEKEVESRLREDLEALSKPCLHNMDTPGKFKFESMF